MILKDWLETLQESAESTLSLTVSYVPKLLGALLLVLAGSSSLNSAPSPSL